MDRAGNKLIYEVQNINYNMVGDINLLDKTTVELSDLLQKKQAETNQIKDNLDKLKN
jgi:hypothetical protein